MSDTNRPTPETDAIMANVRIAMEADTREQSIAHREEAARCIEELERQRDEARESLARLERECGECVRQVAASDTLYRATCKERDEATARADKAEAEVNRLTAIVTSASMAEKCEDARVSLLAISDLLRQAMAYCLDRGELSGCAMPDKLLDACEMAAAMTKPKEAPNAN